MFADDTNILGVGLPTLDDVIEVCEEWAEKNRMKLNKNKSKIMFMEDDLKYNKWEKDKQLKYKGYGIVLSYKSLGLIIQRNGLFDKQLTAITNKAKTNNKMISLLKMYNANPEYKIMVWYSHVQCHFRYANLIWNESMFDWK